MSKLVALSITSRYIFDICMPPSEKPKSRQQRWQEKQFALKRCAVCGCSVGDNSPMCPVHRLAAKERLRKRRGSVRQYTTLAQWQAVDWSEPIETIAAKMGVSPGTARWRKRTLQNP